MQAAHFYNAIAIALESDYRSIAKIHEQYGSWEKAYIHLAGTMAVPDPLVAWEGLIRAGIHLTLLEDPAYPQLLAEIPHPPFALYSRGSLARDSFLSFAIVGTRRATPEGRATARRFARELAQANFSIMSGLAFGIDCATHEGCLESGGSTVAILANGLDSVYPSTNGPLAEKILASGGMVISEYPPGSPPLPYRFLERNRIVSGLSRGVLVIESPIKSGSLATARFALEQNRDLFVVPGSIAHPNFFGSHALIRQGAELVTKPQEILEAYGVGREEDEEKEYEGASNEEKLILHALYESSVPIDVDKIIFLTKLEPRIANRTITFLLVKNIIKESGSGYIMSSSSS
jgi:DNA processing protein